MSNADAETQDPGTSPIFRNTALRSYARRNELIASPTVDAPQRFGRLWAVVGILIVAAVISFSLQVTVPLDDSASSVPRSVVSLFWSAFFG